MIYLDTSVVLAQLLAEDRRPPETLWVEPLVSSRLLEYEVWTRLNARNLGTSHDDSANQILARIAMVEMLPPVLGRVLEPFPVPVRTLDAIHLGTLDFLRESRQNVSLATYDQRMEEAAQAMGFTILSI